MNSSLRSQSGQTIVEYILLLVVVLIIGLGTIWQFNTAFRDYAKGYFVNYIACLLRSGELPNIGSAPSGASAQQNAASATVSGGGSSCDSELQPFNMKNGKSATSLASVSANAASGGKNAKSAASGNGNSGGSGSGADSSGGSSGTDGGPGGGSYNSRLKSSSTGSTGRSKKVPLSNADRQGGDGFSLKFGKNDLETVSKGGHLYGSGYDDGGSELNASAEGKTPTSATRIPINDEDRKKRNGKFVSAAIQHRELANIDDDQAFNFTNVFRWVMIICIIILMIIFFGGQAARISKSMEKSD